MNSKISEIAQSTPSTASRDNHGHGWMMIGCAVMLALLLILVATEAVGTAVPLAAAACIAMMAAMILMMSRSMGAHDHHGNG